jgi:hypothetical protein
MSNQPSQSVTTERLMEQISEDVQRMSPQQKAKVRQELDKAFPPQKEPA